MKAPQEIRYQADGAQTTSPEPVIFPLRLNVERPTYEAAVLEARTIIEELGEEVARFVVKGATLKMGDFGQRYEQNATELILKRESEDEVHLELGFFLLLTFEVRGRFWERAEMIARHIDFIQQFCQKPRAKQTTLSMEQSRFLNQGIAAPGGR